MKFGFYVSSNLDDDNITEIKHISEFNHLQFAMQYLGCPVYLGRKKGVYFNNMVSKVSNRLQGWQGRLLFYGGKNVLIKCVTSSPAPSIVSAIFLENYFVANLKDNL